MLVQQASRQRNLEVRVRGHVNQAVPEKHESAAEPVDARPGAIRSVEDDAVDARQADVAQILAVEALGVAHEAVAQRISKGIHAGEVAEVERRAEDVDAGDGVLPPVAGVAAGARAERGRVLRGVLGVGAQRADRLERLGRAARRRDQHQVRAEGAGGQELVDEALCDT